MNTLLDKITYDDDYRRWGEELAIEEREHKTNHLFEIYRLLSLISASDTSISEVLIEMGISELEVYGYGEIANIFLNLIDDRINVTDIYDKKLAGNEALKGNIIKDPSEISNKTIPLVITPGKYIRQISFELMDQGVNRRRILSIFTILDYCLEKIKQGKNWIVPNFWDKKFLILSAGFSNKGSQSMLYTAMDCIRKRWNNSEIFFLPEDSFSNYPEELQKKYRLHFLLYNRHLGSPLYDFFTNIDCVINIGGYELGSRLPWGWNEQFLYYSNIAINYNIPLYRMPQSYGPFDFPDSIQKKIERDLQYAEAVYVREKSFFEDMKYKYKLSNLRYSVDLVLQNKELDINNVFVSEKLPAISFDEKDINCVAIVPNERCCDYADKNLLLSVYNRIVKGLLREGMIIYIVSHSDDETICREVYDMFSGEEKVKLYLKDMDCIEFSGLVENFNFIIASRYHSIVHAYKKGVPAVIIGWAEKYKELAELFEQDKYRFDVNEGLTMDGIIDAVNRMIDNYKAESKRIIERITMLQDSNCFDDIKF